MGTRNLTVVKLNKKIKVAQYGQWDGYPTGQGQEIADFLKKVDLIKFKKQINSLGLYSENDIKNALIEVGGDPESEWITCDLADKRDKNHPALSRNHGAGILQLIHNGEVTKVVLNEDFKKDSLYCEYDYEIDLDNETVCMNSGEKYTFKQWCRKGFMKKLEDKDNDY